MNPNLSFFSRDASRTLESLLSLVAWGLVACGVLVLLAGWFPNRSRARALESRLERLAQPVGGRQEEDRSIAGLLAQVSREQAIEAQLHAELDHWIGLRNTFSRSSESPRLLRYQEEGRIDFKVALFNARTNLTALAESRHARIPPTLGIHETLSTDTRVETALGQLSATVRLVERVMESGVKEIERIQPLAPRLALFQNGAFDRLREYPILITARGSFEQYLRLLTLLADSGNGFALQHFSIEKPALQESFGPSLVFHVVATAGRPLPMKRDDPFQEESSEERFPGGFPKGRSGRNAERSFGGPDGAIRFPTNQWSREDLP